MNFYKFSTRSRGFWCAFPSCGNAQAMNQRVVLILEATDSAPERPVIAVHAGNAATEVQAPRARTRHGTRPIVAAAADIVERTIAAVAVARQGQFQRRGISPGRIAAAPALALFFPLGFGGQSVAGRAWVVDSVYTLP